MYCVQTRLNLCTELKGNSKGDRSRPCLHFLPLCLSQWFCFLRGVSRRQLIPRCWGFSAVRSFFLVWNAPQSLRVSFSLIGSRLMESAVQRNGKDGHSQGIIHGDKRSWFAGVVSKAFILFLGTYLRMDRVV